MQKNVTLIAHLVIFGQNPYVLPSVILIFVASDVPFHFYEFTFQAGLHYLTTELFAYYQFGPKPIQNSTAGKVLFCSIPTVCSENYIGPKMGTSRC